ncbi:replication initiation negative regulator SeqA [Pasteurella skyensis]|uniref:Negative modulator of initiation of replication n=1 Tax=Phocoenobacter skyensis TaxID=97481 RepID=A0AAJ6P1S8_9PAST|nr:replication initiation negative regulator SeqA [Pasteurella skyensis]MDP8169719.1 replication initiation negative regulator SeqA [Pasteurella skyensis]MDP8173955.1 replication initiation negative regulator SeqA [Pasteurella skyensis]
MKKIEVDDELYHYIASRTQSIGETASDILRRLLRLPAAPKPFVLIQEDMINELKNLVKESPKAKKEAQAKDLEFLLKHLDKVLKSSEFIDETKVVKRFLMILAALYFAAPQRFAYGTENIQGSERIYFAKDAETILSTGSGVRAKRIPDSPFWVITNNNTARKGLILVKLMEAMQVPEELIERIRAQFV